MRRRAEQYTSARGASLVQPLGGGNNGAVWLTSRATALKVHRHAEPFAREVNAYRALAGARSIAGHMVPRFLDADDSLLAFEMTVVRPPYVLDFASVYPLVTAPQFPPEIMEDWVAEKREQFGADWPKAAAIIRAFERDHGLRLLDVHPGNICFASEAGP